MFRNLFLASLLVFSTSCSVITEPAKEAAKDWWSENGKNVVTDAANAAKNYWDKNKEQIIESAVNAARAVGEAQLEKAMAYVDQKLQEQRDRAVTKLIENGAKLEDIDYNRDGKVSDEELQNYVESNPMALWYAGGALAAWWSLLQIRKKINPQVQAQS